MSVRAILTTLILGSSTVALAQPGDWQRRDDERREHRDREWREHHDGYRGGYRGEVSIQGPTRLARRLELDTAGQLAGLSTLRIEPRGYNSTFVERVVLIYSDREPRALRIDRRLDANGGAIQVPLGDSKDVVRVIITGRSERGARIQIDAV